MSVPAASRARQRSIFLAVAVFAAVLYAGLGFAVSSSPPGPIDRALLPLAGHGTELAALFTRSGLLPALAAIGVAALMVAWYYPQWRGRAYFAVIVNLIGWKLSDALKLLFHRARQDQWYVFHESSYGYSSGHAMFAVIVYGLWAYFLWRSDVPRLWRAAAAALLVLWGVGVSWSRLALGAHYASDVIGGWLLGVVVLSAGFALYDPLPKRDMPAAAIRPGPANEPPRKDSRAVGGAKRTFRP